MVGVPGAGGPIPKRADQRRNRNKKANELKTAPTGTDPSAETRKPNSKWHPVAKRWFESLSKSGQSVFYEESDWAAAWLLAESMSRELQPQIVKVLDDGRQVKAHVPPTGAALSAWLKGMTALLVTEGDRRRAQIELTRSKTDGDGEVANVSNLEEYRLKLMGSSS